MTFVEEVVYNTARFLDNFRTADLIGNLPEYKVKPRTDFPKRSDGYWNDSRYQIPDIHVKIDDLYSMEQLEFVPEMFRNTYRTGLKEKGINEVVLSAYPIEKLENGRNVVGKRDGSTIYLWKERVRPSLLRARLGHEAHEGETYITDKPHYKVGQEALDWFARIGDTDAYLDTLEINMNDLDHVRPVYKTAFSMS